MQKLLLRLVVRPSAPTMTLKRGGSCRSLTPPASLVSSRPDNQESSSCLNSSMLLFCTMMLC